VDYRRNKKLAFSAVKSSYLNPDVSRRSLAKAEP
jgi:hypothetical protein